MAKKQRIFELPQTKGTFVARGIVTGTDKDSFYTEKKTKNNKDFRAVNFGVEYEKGKTIYVSLNGMPRDNVYFYKRGENGGKGESKAIPWSDRFTYAEEGFKMIGVNVGVSKTTDDKGKEVNDKKTTTEFDACKLIAENLKDGQSVFVKGNVEFGSYETDKGEKKSTVKFVPTQVSLCKDVDFEAEDFAPMHEFTQQIVVTGFSKDDDGRQKLEAKIVNYESVENAEFYINTAELASMFKKHMKPYNAIEVHGEVDVITATEEVTDDEDCWGEANKMKQISSPTKREFTIHGADGKTLDTKVYTADSINDAINKAKNKAEAKTDYENASDAGWGDSAKLSKADEDDDDGWE